MNKTIVDGQEVKIGDFVSFKSDFEQYGKIKRIYRGPMGGVMLTLEKETGFSGDYIGGDTVTDVMASECWVD